MENNINVQIIGRTKIEKDQFLIQIDKPYRSGLKNISGFSNLQIVWWGHKGDEDNFRKNLVTRKPYRSSPDELGVFATRSQFRPNPILITTIFAFGVDENTGIISTPYIDADHDTPVLDIKPYHNLERVKNCQVPDWCSHWPKWYEEAGEFNWAEEFNF